jgi:hypothetical protein
MHCSLDTSSKQLTRFFDVQKNLSFSLENKTIKTYIHSNDREPINSKLLSSLPSTFSIIINVFEKNNSVKWKNNCSVSGFLSNNSLDNSLTENLKSVPTPFSLVSFKRESQQQLDSRIVFSPLLLLFTHPLLK